MLVADDSAVALRFLKLLFPELHRLGVNQDSPDYQILLVAIENILPHCDIRDASFQRSPPRLIPAEKSSPTSSDLLFSDDQLEEEVKRELQECLGSGFAVPSFSCTPTQSTVKEVETVGLIVNPAETLDCMTASYDKKCHYSLRESTKTSTASCENVQLGVVNEPASSVHADSSLPMECETTNTRVSSDIANRTCSVCNKLFSSAGNLRKHNVIHNPNGDHPFKCSWSGCSRSFIQRSSLAEHFRIHTGDRPFKCSWKDCSKSYAQRGDLTRHTMTHTGDRPFKCSWEDCRQSFNKKSALKSHTRIHAGQRLFGCSWPGCSKTFDIKSKLNRHMKTHTADRPFKCSEAGCESSFFHQCDLITHTRIHTGDRPFKCSWKDCSKSYAQQGDLTRHLKAHTGDRPFKCSWVGCGKSFTKKNGLTNHTRTHTGLP